MYPLPPYARRIEYLESDGAAYIDTGIDAQSELIVKTEIYAPRSGASSVGTVFGGRTAYHENSILVWIGLASNVQSVRFDYANSEQCVANDDSNFSIVLDNNRGTINGISLDHTAASFNSHIPIHIFGLNNNGTHSAMLSATKVKTFSISLNGTPVRSFIPCRILDTGYLWDEVEGRFYGNSGTGDFVLGPDVREGVVPGALCPMGVGRRQEEIRRVEYLEATGTQYVDTGVILTPAHRIEADFEFTQVTPRQQRVFEQYDRTGHLFVALYINGAGNIGYAWSQTAADWKSVTSAITARRRDYIMDGPNRILQVGSTTATLPLVEDTGPGEATVTLGSKDQTGVKPTYGKWYSASISRGADLVRDFVPVAIGSTGYLLDRVSGQLFGNPGAGDFVVGPDVSRPAG